jgi:hypothetical protein
MSRANHRAAACFLSGLLLLGGCRKAAPAPGSAVTFSLSETATRLGDTEGDTAVDTWALLLYRNGKLAGTGTSATGAPIRLEELEAGAYTAWAVANPPASFQPEGYPDQSAFAAAESDLRDNGPARLLMTGSLSFRVPVPGDAPLSIGVERLVCQVGIRKISTAFTDPVLASLPFTLKAIYMTNCYAKTRLERDLTEPEMDAGTAFWYNRMGFRSDSGVNTLLRDGDIDTAVSPASPYTQAHGFYCYPNPATADDRSGDWSIRRTRLVLEAEIGGHPCYYPVTLPPMQRNRTYLIEEAIIRNMGAGDPEEDIPGVIDLVFRTGTGSWAPEYTVHENS